MDESVNEGKLSLDLLIGLSIFLFTFIFVASFLPGVFADVRNEINLAHEIYKVTVLLSETKGAWKNLTHNGTDWENKNICDKNFTFLPGLSKGEPDYLSFEKIQAFNNFCNLCVEKCRKMLGLDVSNVNFHVSLESLYSKPYNRTLVRYYGLPLLDAGNPLPQGGNVIRFERYVWLDAIPGLTGVYIVQNLQGGAVPSHGWLCELRAGVNYCSFTRSYPLTSFSVKLLQISNSPTISICIDRSEIGGTCPLGSKEITLIVGKKNEPDKKTTIEKELLPIYEDFLEIVNGELQKMGLSKGDTVYVEIALRDVYAIFDVRDEFMADYMAGKAVAKLVVYGW